MNCDARFCAYCDRPKPPVSRPRWFGRRATYRCECGLLHRATRSGWREQPPREPSESVVLESRIPVLNPWAGVAVLALHSHTADEPCDEWCSVHEEATRALPD